MAGDQFLCHIPKMTEIEPAIQPFYVRDGVSLDHLRHGHIDFDPAWSTCNMMQMRHYRHRRDLEQHCPGQLGGDLARPLPEALNNKTEEHENGVRRVHKRSETVRNAFNDFQNGLAQNLEVPHGPWW